MSQENPETVQPKTVTSAQTLRKASAERIEGVLVELPSGAVVRCKRPSIGKLIAEGHIPTDVAAVLFDQEESKPGKQARVNPKEMPKLLNLQRYIAEQAVVEPAIVENPDYDKNQVSIDVFDDADLSFIMQFVQTGNKDLALFRSVGAGDMARPGVQEVPGAAS